MSAFFVYIRLLLPYKTHSFNLQLLYHFHAAVYRCKQKASSYSMTSNDIGENKEVREPLWRKFLWEIDRSGHAWATWSIAPQRQLWHTCKRFKFNQAYRAWTPDLSLKAPTEQRPSSSLLTQRLWRDGIYPVLHSPHWGLLCVVGRPYQGPRVKRRGGWVRLWGFSERLPHIYLFTIFINLPQVRAKLKFTVNITTQKGLFIMAGMKR